MSKQANKRLQKEYASLAKTPPPFVLARPYESNLLECHFIIQGPSDSPYSGGQYHGVLTFPSSYPFAPPGIVMRTPSGRFQPDRKICTSFSDFHAGSWNPAWSVSTILTGLLSFMLSDEMTTGSTRSTDAEKRALAAQSHAWNCKNPKFKQIFPEHAGLEMQRLPNMGEADLGKPDGPPLPDNLGNPDGPKSTITPESKLQDLTTALGSTSIKSENSIASSGTATSMARAKQAPLITRRWVYGLGALVAVAFVMRMVGG